MRAYAGVMQEIKLRLLSVGQVTPKNLAIHPVLASEFCHLQLRMACELIAIGCLIVHGDVASADDFREYAADRVMKRLHDLHPAFYPTPYRSDGVILKADGTRRQHIRIFTHGDYLMRDELIALYRKCGDVLHRGSAKKFLSEPSLPAVNFSDLQVWLDKVSALLSMHSIALLDENVRFICQLKNSKGEVDVALLERDQEGFTTQDVARA